MQKRDVGVNATCSCFFLHSVPAVFNRCFGLEKTTSLGSKYSGSNSAPSHSIVSSYSSFVGSWIVSRMGIRGTLIQMQLYIIIDPLRSTFQNSRNDLLMKSSPPENTPPGHQNIQTSSPLHGKISSHFHHLCRGLNFITYPVSSLRMLWERDWFPLFTRR